MRISDWISDVCSSDLFGAVEAWNDAVHDAASGIVAYETHYRIASTGRHLAARAQIRFTPKEELEELIAEAGLHATRWLRSEERRGGKEWGSTCRSWGSA